MDGVITTAQAASLSDLLPRPTWSVSLADKPAPLPDVDPATLRAALRGEPQAFAALLDHYDVPLRALVFRIVGDRDAMDDVLQEVAIKAFRALPSFRGESTLGTWLYRITYTTCINHLRRTRHADRQVDAESADLIDPAPDPADAVAHSIDLAAALATLPVEQRVVLLLVLQQGFDHRTAGEVLGIPEGTVASRLFAARTTLRRLLREPEPGEVKA